MFRKILNRQFRGNPSRTGRPPPLPLQWWRGRGCCHLVHVENRNQPTRQQGAFNFNQWEGKVYFLHMDSGAPLPLHQLSTAAVQKLQKNTTASPWGPRRQRTFSILTLAFLCCIPKTTLYALLLSLRLVQSILQLEGRGPTRVEAKLIFFHKYWNYPLL